MGGVDKKKLAALENTASTQAKDALRRALRDFPDEMMVLAMGPPLRAKRLGVPETRTPEEEKAVALWAEKIDPLFRLALGVPRAEDLPESELARLSDEVWEGVHLTARLREVRGQLRAYVERPGGGGAM